MRPILAIALTLALAACEGPLSLLTGGGPNVGVNAQVGAENRQAGVSVERQAPSVSIRPNARTGDIRQDSGESRVRADSVQTVVVNEANVWLMILAVMGWTVAGMGWIDNIVRGLRGK